MSKKPQPLNVSLVRDVPDEHLIAIGRVITNWSGIEVAVDISIGKILNVHAGAAAAVTVGISLPYKLDMLEGLAFTALHSGPIRDELISILKAIRACQANRNFVAHAHWVGDPDEKNRIQGYILRRNNTGDRLEYWSDKEINRIADDIIKAEGDLLGWVTLRKPRRRQVSWHERFPQKSHKSHRTNVHERKNE